MRFSLAVLLSALLAGCVSYEYVAPSTPEGVACTSVCNRTRDQCTARENRIAREEKDRCERNELLRQNRCLVLAKNDADKANCLKEKNSCYTSANTYHCSSEYDQCFQGCGGQIIEHKS
ncbi:hypothetical protein SAMN02745857_01360 [Andreprevotia lacus DSM 23236]|uniref:Lipoprotein n=1 Tax=Andreprevotia lacus DSM 23236 TaxID=1121001 RepID=A0A1W1XE24_9NEIS|nr:hypothetical protein [Andreprevotia lacus]SMC22196.1 hypothetical protein SAMN02745857_01360 [Andreprevotia lacus DSM 23236]